MTELTFNGVESELDPVLSGDFIEKVTGTGTIGGNSEPFAVPPQS
jgi:hypothetical protein